MTTSVIMTQTCLHGLVYVRGQLCLEMPTRLSVYSKHNSKGCTYCVYLILKPRYKGRYFSTTSPIMKSFIMHYANGHFPNTSIHKVNN